MHRSLFLGGLSSDKGSALSVSRRNQTLPKCEQSPWALTVDHGNSYQRRYKRFQSDRVLTMAGIDRNRRSHGFPDLAAQRSPALKVRPCLSATASALTASLERRARARVLRAVDRAEGARREEQLARVRVLMCCVDPAKGELTTVPQESWDDWVRRMAEQGTLYRDPGE